MGDIGTAVSAAENAVENNYLTVIPTPAGPMPVPVVIPNVNDVDTNKEIALGIEQALKNIGKTIDEYLNDKGEINLEAVKEVLSPSEQKRLDERLELASGSRPTITTVSDYLQNNEFGQILNSALTLEGYDALGKPIYSATGGAGNFIQNGDKISFAQDSIQVFDKNGALISILNLDGTQNSTLTDMSSGKQLSSIDKLADNGKNNQLENPFTSTGSTASTGGAGLPPDDNDDKKDQEKDSSQGNRDPKDRIQHEDYKDELRAKMEKPHVDDIELKKITDKLYRPNAKVGSGSTADAVRYEISTGEKVNNRLHIQKAQNTIKELQNWINKNPTASSGDRAAAENMLKDLQNSLKGK